MEKDIGMVMGSFSVYIISLAESERVGEIGEKLKLFENAVVNEVGDERARKIWSTDRDITARESLMRSIHCVSKVAWWLSDPSTLPLAEDALSKLQIRNQDCDPIWLYLKWRLQKTKGNSELADFYLKKLLDPNGKIGYTQFRYLRRHLGESAFQKHKMP